MFKPVSSSVDIQKVEKDQLDFWRANKVFERTMTEREGALTYVFYEGPPTANGQPGSHHVLARSFKDMFPRYKTMRGFYSYRKGGWDTHGLPVEIAVQKELGIDDKAGIVEYGIDKFNARCRETVFRNIADWERMTERMAYWVNLDDAYVTFTNDYIESVWWVLKKFWEKGLLFRGLKVVPYSPVSGTPLSSHEVSLGYKTITDPSVFVRFPLRDKPGVYFLAWTTTPWTLPSNVALAVGEDIDYVQVEGPAGDDEDGTEQLILAESLLEKALKNADDYSVVKRMKGKDLVGQHYDPLYTFFPIEGKDYAYVVAGDFVSTVDGTGIVHIAPAYGVDDMAMGDKYDLPVIKAVEADGKFVSAVTQFRGQDFREANKDIVRDLKARGLLLRRENYEHNYPHDWRTGTPLMYFARETWFIRATEYRQQMVDLNQTIKWVPEHIRDGRFGNWLDDLKDWALGRERFWGTPLNVWVDDETGETLAVGSVKELSDLAGRDLSELDLHRPYVDEITFPNPNGSGGTMRRVPEVIDVWFDSGAMPFAQWGYPANNAERFETQYPADYICEAVDQTRGWFYSLHAISAMLNESVAYKNVICLGHILDGEGQKMSKSKGNIVDPWSVLNTSGADAFRWYLYTSAPPGEPRRFSEDLVKEVISKFWLTLWNTYSFFVTYANLDGWKPTDVQPPVAERGLMDRWLIAELNLLVKDITDAFEDYDATAATRPIQDFVDTLSNWYVRLNRRRYWKSESDTDKSAAYATLYEALVTVSKLIAPTMPFLSEALYRNLVTTFDKDAPDSVHLAMWPEVDEALIDEALVSEMRVAEKLVSLGRAARETVGIGIRQPLARAQFVTPTRAEGSAITTFGDIITDELNVKTLETLEGADDLVSYSLNPIPRYLGRKFGADFPRVQTALREGDPADIKRYAQTLLRGEDLSFEIDGETFEVTPEEVEVIQDLAMEGFALAEDMGYVAALDTDLDDELLAEGLAREVVRRIQDMRKAADFEIQDNIEVVYTASERLAAAIEKHAAYIKEETLATSIATGEAANGFHKEVFEPKPEDLDDETKQMSIKVETLTLGVKRA